LSLSRRKERRELKSSRIASRTRKNQYSEGLSAKSATKISLKQLQMRTKIPLSSK
jgi:hypothetical protein